MFKKCYNNPTCNYSRRKNVGSTMTPLSRWIDMMPLRRRYSGGIGSSRAGGSWGKLKWWKSYFSSFSLSTKKRRGSPRNHQKDELDLGRKEEYISRARMTIACNLLPKINCLIFQMLGLDLNLSVAAWRPRRLGLLLE